MTDLAPKRAGSKVPVTTIFQNQVDSFTNLSNTFAENAAHTAHVLVMPSRDVTLFATPPPQTQGLRSFAGSVLIHIIAVIVIWFSLGYKPPIAKVITDHYPVRELDLIMPPLPKAKEAPRIHYPKPDTSATAKAGESQPAPLLHPMTKAQLGPQTLIQPDVLKPITLPQNIPVPQVVLWAPNKTIVKKIVPPAPAKTTAANVPPVIERPNHEINLSDVNIASSSLPSVKLRLAPSTTSPVTVQAPEKVQAPPASVSQQSATPTPATVLSLSDLRLNKGTAELPPVNESPASNSQGALGTGQSQNSSAQGGNGNGAGKSGTGQNSQGAGSHPGSSLGSGASTSEGASIAPGLGSGSNASGRFTTTPIDLPKDGHFSSVVVGNSLEQKFPEVSDVWNGRLAYTAYLRVGLPKNWILQYSLPRGAASAPGAISRLEAPWPYNIVRPNIAPGSIDADALMIHGFVNQSGRFEGLNIVFPDAFASAQFVLAALQQWQFRPATQNDQVVRVEVLLIIPGEEE